VGGPIHDAEQVCETFLRDREWSYQVYVYVAEPLDGVGDETRRRNRLGGDLGPLALLAISAPGRHLRGQPRPNETT
jgi:hypothetical protein